MKKNRRKSVERYIVSRKKAGYSAIRKKKIGKNSPGETPAGKKFGPIARPTAKEWVF